MKMDVEGAVVVVMVVVMVVVVRKDGREGWRKGE